MAKSLLTDKQWVDLIRLFCEYLRKDLRMGQSYFNALAKVNPDLADKITDTEYDCFYDDNKVVNFIEYLRND